MFAVERLGSYITRGVNTVSGPFHPFGGAVDIVVVEQKDGTFKSSPWYVRFGKFQGVLKAKEKIVNISVDGVEANFHMYLDHKGVAYFLREVDGADEVDSLLWPLSSGEEADGQYHDRRTIKSKSCIYDTAQSNLITEIGVSNGKVLARTNSRRSRILGLVFGRKSMKEGRVRDVNSADFVRTDSLDRAEIAANLLEVRWSTNLVSDRLGKDGAPHFLDSDNKGSEDSDNGRNMFENSCDIDNLSWTSFRKLERPAEETGVEMSCIGRSTLGESSDEGDNDLNCETPRKINDISLANADLDDDDMKVVKSEIVRSDSQVPDSSMLESDQENDYEEDNGVLLEADRVQAIIYCDISEKSRIGSDNFSCGKCWDMKLCAEVVHESTELISESEIISSTANSEKLTCEEDEINKLGPTMDPVCDSQGITSDFVTSMVSNIPPPEGSEEEQFLFSDGDDFKVREAVNESSDVNSEADSSPDKFEELRQGSKIMSCNVDIPIKGKVAINEVGHVVNSLPNMGSRFDELGEHHYHLHDPLLGHSLDSSTKSSKWMLIRKDLSNCVKLARDEEQQLSNSSKPSTEDSQISEALKISPATPEAGNLSKITEPPSGRWGLWPFKRSRSIKGSQSARISSRDFNAFESINSSSRMEAKRETPNRVGNKKKIRATTPTSEQLASLNLKEGRNVVTFTFSTAMLGQQQVDAQIYLWRWDTRIVISDVDGTITKSDILGQFMPLVGKDWSQTGVAHFFSAIKENGYQMLFLSARAISQAYHTRQFLFNLKQDGKALPDGPVFISPDGLFPSLFREVIRRAPHEFKISCLEDIKALFPPDRNPFYAGFGNRDTDEFSYLKVGIPKGKIFIINPKGEVVVNRRVDSKSYTSLKALVDDMFPPMTSSEQEDFNSWNYWKLPPPDIIC